MNIIKNFQENIIEGRKAIKETLSKLVEICMYGDVKCNYNVYVNDVGSWSIHLSLKENRTIEIYERSILFNCNQYSVEEMWMVSRILNCLCENDLVMYD